MSSHPLPAFCVKKARWVLLDYVRLSVALVVGVTPDWVVVNIASRAWVLARRLLSTSSAPAIGFPSSRFWTVFSVVRAASGSGLGKLAALDNYVRSR